jgi:hypothetical protein
MSLASAFLRRYAEDLQDAMLDVDHVMLYNIFLPGTSVIARLVTDAMTCTSCTASKTEPIQVNDAIEDPYVWCRMAFPSNSPEWHVRLYMALESALAPHMDALKARLAHMAGMGSDDAQHYSSMDDVPSVAMEQAFRTIGDAPPDGPVYDAMFAAFQDGARFPTAMMWMNDVLKTARAAKFAAARPAICTTCNIVHVLFMFDVLSSFSGMEPAQCDAFLVTQLQQLDIALDVVADTVAIGKLDAVNSRAAAENRRRQRTASDLATIDGTLDAQLRDQAEIAEAARRAATIDVRILIALTVFSVMYITYTYTQRNVWYRHAIVQVAIAIAFIAIISIECVHLMKRASAT